MAIAILLKRPSGGTFMYYRRYTQMGISDTDKTLDPSVDFQIITDYNGFGGEVNAAKQQGDIAWGFQPQAPETSGLRPEVIRGKIQCLIYRTPPGCLV